MHDERFEGTRRTLDDQLIPFHHIQNVDTPARIVRHLSGEPVAACLDKLVLMQAGAFLTPVLPFGTRLEMVDQLVAYEIRLPFPLNDM